MTVSVQTPPMVSGGVPVLGHLLEFQRDRGELFRRGYNEHGEVFAINIASQKMAIIVGPENQADFYRETDKKLNIAEAHEFLKAMAGEVLLTAPVEAYNNQRPILREVFGRQKMAGYILAMAQAVRAWIDELGDEGEFEVTDAMNTLAQSVAALAFLGEETQGEVGEEFWSQYQYIGAALDPVLPPHLPLPKFRRRDAARARMIEILKPIIARRRANPGDYDDVLQDILTTELKDGSLVDDQLALNLLIGLMFAGHETTAGQAAWTLIHLLRNPEYHDRVQAEIDEHVPADLSIDHTVLAKLTHTYLAIDETTRLTPSADINNRVVQEDWQLGEFTIPAGWRVMTTGDVTHRLERMYTNPDEFDPLRWTKERGEGDHPYALMGFGGGRHQCTGMNFAKNEMATITAMLLSTFDLELVTPETHIDRGLGANRPSATVIRYKRKAG